MGKVIRKYEDIAEEEIPPNNVGMNFLERMEKIPERFNLIWHIVLHECKVELF